MNRYKMLLLRIIGTFLKEFCYKLQAEVVDAPKAHHKETWLMSRGGGGGGGGRKSSCQRFLSGEFLALHISYTIYFSFVRVLVQGLLLKGLLKVMTSLKDVTRCYLQCTYIKKRLDSF